MVFASNVTSSHHRHESVLTRIASVSYQLLPLVSGIAGLEDVAAAREIGEETYAWLRLIR
jgi:hypothetical protein